MLSFFLPRTCISCYAAAAYNKHNKDTLGKYLCENCLRIFRHLPQPSEAELFRPINLFHDQELPIPHIYAPFPFIYDGLTQTIAHHFKYDQMIRLAIQIGKEITSRLELGKYDYLVPIPLHRVRLHERGYNQAEMIARGVSSETGIPILPAKLFVRKKPTPSQTNMKAKERLVNTIDAFELRRNASDILHHKRLLLVDDVMTTGATMAGAAKALQTADPAAIDLLPFAIVTRDIA